MRIYALIALVFLLQFSIIADAQPKKDDFGKEHDQRIIELLKRLDSKDQLELIDAKLALLEEANNGDLPILVETLRKGNEQPKQIAIIKTLAKIGDPRAADVLRFEIEHGQGEAVLEAITALGHLKTNWAIPLLVNQIADINAKMTPLQVKRSVRALVAIARIQTPRSLDTLKILGKDIRSEFRELLIWLIKSKEGKLEYTKIDSEIPRARGLRLEYKGVGFNFYYPSQYADAPNRPWLLVCIPDIDFRVEELFKQCQAEAVRQKMAVMVPHFHPYQFLEYQSFNIQGRRSDKFLIDLLAYIKQHAEVETNEIYLYGENGGANFVERFVMTYPRRVARAVANNGEIVLADSDVMFPDGTRKTPYAPDIEINVYDYMKSDLYLIFDQRIKYEKRLEVFEKLVNDFKYQRGVMPRLQVVKNKQHKINSFAYAMSVLFHEDKFE